MTEVKALTSFTDKETGAFHEVGSSFSCEDKRAKELADKKAVVILKEAKAVKADAPAKKPTLKKATTKK